MSLTPTPGSVAEITFEWAKRHGLTTWFETETTSTNTVAKAAPPSNSPALFLCERQTAGRGRGLNTWSTAPNSLLCTWRYALSFPPQPILSPLIGLALFEACRESFGNVPFNLKAPNDVFAGEKKLAGLLIELASVGTDVTCAIGLGFNAMQAPAEIASQAAGLAQFLSPDVIVQSWPKFLTALEKGFAEALDAASAPELKPFAREKLREAMNLHPLLKEPVLNVGPLGQIESASRSIDWHEL